MPKLEGVYRASNGSWYFKATVGRDPRTGKRTQITKRGFATATDAGRARRVVLEEIDAGTVPLVGGSITVDALLDLYLDGIDADGRLSAKTRFDYRRNADAYVRPWLGRRSVRDLTPDVLLGWQRELAKRGGTKKGKPLAPKSVRLARSSLAGALKLALQTGMLRTNRAPRTRCPAPWRLTIDIRYIIVRV
jgi:hypothetical protein